MNRASHWNRLLEEVGLEPFSPGKKEMVINMLKDGVEVARKIDGPKTTVTITFSDGSWMKMHTDENE